MKHLLFSALLLIGSTSAGCSKNSDPTPALTPSLVGTWTLTAQTIVVTPKNGGAATTYPQTVVPNTVKLTFTADGKYTTFFDKSVTPSGTTGVYSGTYSYSGTTITYTNTVGTSTGQVDALTATSLTHLVTTEDKSGSYVSVTTNTYTR